MVMVLKCTPLHVIFLVSLVKCRFNPAVGGVFFVVLLLLGEEAIKLAWNMLQIIRFRKNGVPLLLSKNVYINAYTGSSQNFLVLAVFKAEN